MEEKQSLYQQSISIKNILDNFITDTIRTVNGTIKTLRISGGKNNKITFVKLSDGSTVQHMQIIFDGNSKSTNDKDISDANTGLSISVTGLIVKSPGKGQSIELVASTYTIFGQIDAAKYPIAKTQLTLEYLRTVPHLRGRTDTFQSIMRIKSCMRYAFAKYFDKIGFHEVQVPLITDNECESGSNPLQVTTMMDKINGQPIDYTQDFFKKASYLTVSGQLHLEALVVGGLSKAWCMTTACRGEPSHSRLHAAEFWMLELEFCFNTLEDNMKVNEGAVKFVIKRVLDKCMDDLKFLEETYKPGLVQMLQKYEKTPFAITTHEECVKRMIDDIESGRVIVNPDKTDDSLYVWKERPGLNEDLSKDHERYISEVIFDGIPTFVKYYPKSIKSFYMPVLDESAEILTVNNFDCIFPFHGEIIGGSQRIDNYDELISRMKENGIRPETLEFYSDLRKYGTVPHGGSGIGIDRLLLVICGLSNIRDMIPFPRAYELCPF